MDSEAETEAEAEVETDADSEVDVKMDADMETEVEKEAEVEMDSDMETKVEVDSDTEVEEDSKTETEKEADTETETDSETEAEAVKNKQVNFDSSERRAITLKINYKIMSKSKILLVIILVITSIIFMHKGIFELWENYAKHRRHQNTLENMYLYRKYCLDSDDDDEEAKFNCEDIKAIIESTKIDL